MIKSLNLFSIIILIVFSCGLAKAQTLQKLPPIIIQQSENKLMLNSFPPLKTSDSDDYVYGLLALYPFNPIFAIEGGKFYFGFTKEVTLGVFPFGHLGAEYSYFFRDERRDHFRYSYNYDIVLEAGDLGAFLGSVGVGYFTDLHKKGIFPQTSISALIPLVEDIGIMPYLKLRYTIMTEETESNIFDFSFGLRTSFYIFIK